MRRLSVLLLVCGFVVAADWEEALARFRAAYREDSGAEQRKDALLEVAKADVPEAAALLVDTWEKLDRAAAGRRQELWKLRRKIRAARQELDGADRRRRAALRAELTDLNRKDVEVNTRLAALEIEQDAVLTGLGTLQSPASLAWLAQTGLARAKSSSLLLRTVARRLDTKTLGAALARARKADRIIPLLQAIRGSGRLEHDPTLNAVLKHLTHRDWAVRVAAAHAVASAGRADGVGALVKAIAREKPRSRAQREVARALAILTGQNLGPEPALWARWWRDHEAEVLAGKLLLGHGKPPGPKSDQGRFYGIPQVADRNIYVLDVSGSMEVSMLRPRWVDGHAVAARDDEDSRFDVALRELKRATKALRPAASLAVLVYADHVTALHDELVPATPENHAALVRALDPVGPAGSTNIYEALDFALRLANVHPESPRGASRADAIYLISDGSPTDSKGNKEDPQRTLQAVRAWNAHQRVAIHAVGIGRQHNASFLRQLAQENGGTYLGVVPKRK
ncbi:MAG: VWA domain-containing protein [Planctomycetota bacterium]